MFETILIYELLMFIIAVLAIDIHFINKQIKRNQEYLNSRNK